MRFSIAQAGLQEDGCLWDRFLLLKTAFSLFKLFDMKKRLLMIGYNYSPELTGIGKYSGEMISWLANHGYDCTVITTYPYYPYWKVQAPYYQDRFWYKTERQKVGAHGKIKVCRCPVYVPAVPSGLKRILLDFSFLVTAFFKLLQLLPAKKFDYVIAVAPSFQIGLLGAFYRMLRKSYFLYHIQDMQIEAARDLKMIKSRGIIDTLFKFEKYIFNQASGISSISEEMNRRIYEKAGKEVFLFPNWTNTRLFYPATNKAELKKEFGFAPSDKIILYSGAIGEKQGLEAVLRAAKTFEEQKNLKFLICGSGPYKEKLKELANSLKLYNVFFLPLQPFETFNTFLNIADVHLVMQKGSASDLVMPSKLTTILSIGGLALVTANKGTGLHALIQKHQIGLLVESDNQHSLNQGIQTAISGKNEHCNKNARLYAETYLSIDQIMDSLERKLRGGLIVQPSGREIVIQKKGEEKPAARQDQDLFRKSPLQEGNAAPPRILRDRKAILQKREGLGRGRKRILIKKVSSDHLPGSNKGRGSKP